MILGKGGGVRMRPQLGERMFNFYIGKTFIILKNFIVIIYGITLYFYATCLLVDSHWLDRGPWKILVTYKWFKI